MKRITVDQIREAYRTTGMKPQVDSMFDVCFDQATPKCGCGLGTLYVAAGGADFTVCVTDVAKRCDLDRSYACGFSDGFDGVECDASTWCGDVNEPDYDLGYDDGKAAGDVMLDRV